jgi:hypothetical protein
MANIIYTRLAERLASGNLSWATAVVRVMLERSTSTYAPNKDHNFVSDLTGFVEISVASYARQTAANKASNKDDANDRQELDLDDVSFGNLEAGQTVKGFLLYVQTGGNDSTPNDDSLIAYFDTVNGLPALPVPLGGGLFTIPIDVEGLIQISQA